MSACFLDTNILLYAFNADDRRQPDAMRLLESNCIIGVQCLNEFAYVARRKLRLSWDEIVMQLRIIAEFSPTVVPLTVDLHRLGMRVAKRHTLSVYDGMIVAAALTADCAILYSEDMHHGLVVDGRLTVVNPFAPAG